jgi:GNAT superfamily N-acetyltransferase
MMQLTEVTNRAQAREFIQVNPILNRNNPHYIQPLDKDVEQVFDPKKNKSFRHGECARWILKDSEGRLAGRIAAYANRKYKNKGDEVPVGGIGFFDCINQQEAADMLFDVARHWLTQKGFSAMDGPINFGERDRWWGLVVEGFQEPMYGMNYNPPYYQALFEHYGFRLYFQQVCFGMNPQLPMSKKVQDRHAAYAGRPEFKAIHIDKRRLEKFAADLTIVYNKAWAGHGGLRELKKDQVMAMFKQMKPVMDEKIIWFAYHNEEPIGMFVNLPDLNQWFKHVNGKFDLLHKLKFLWVKKTKPNKKFTGILFGIAPEYQGKGIDAFMINEASKVIMGLSYSEYEMQWIGDFNPKMINVAENLGDVTRTRVLTTYRYNFDPSKEVKRYPIIH